MVSKASVVCRFSISTRQSVPSKRTITAAIPCHIQAEECSRAMSWSCALAGVLIFPSACSLRSTLVQMVLYSRATGGRAAETWPATALMSVAAVLNTVTVSFRPAVAN